MAVGVSDRDMGGREDYPPPPSRGGDDLPGPPNRPPPGERERAEDRAARKKRQEIIGVSIKAPDRPSLCKCMHIFAHKFCVVVEDLAYCVRGQSASFPAP